MKQSILTWLADRFTEPSSHAGIAGMVAAGFAFSHATTDADKAVAVVGGLFSLMALAVPEKATAIMKAAKQ